jgi:exosortase H (IPTLxxWG-CTERM-specific)
MQPIIKNLKASFYAKYPVLRFIIIFATLMGAFYFLFFTPFFNRLFPTYLQFNAKMSGIILNWLGQNVSVVGANIISSQFSISIKGGCDGLEPTAFFICAVLAFPAPFLLKIPGVILGTLCLVILNFARIISLFLIGVYYPQAFEIMHIEVWQVLFIIFALSFFILWLLWAIQHEISQQQITG